MYSERLSLKEKKGTKISFHTFGVDKKRNEAWIQIIENAIGIRTNLKIDAEYRAVCGLNFTPSDYKSGTRLHPGAVPSIFNIDNEISSTCSRKIQKIADMSPETSISNIFLLFALPV